MQRCVAIKSLLVGLLLACSLCMHAAYEDVESSDGARGKWENRHIWLSERFLYAVESMDNLFGDERIDEETQHSRMRVRMGLKYSRLDGASLNTGIRLRLVLPKFKQRLHLVFDDFFESDSPDSSSSLLDAAQDSSADLALRFWLGEQARNRLNLDFGGRSNPTQGLVRLRNRFTRSEELSELQFTQSLLWLTHDGWEAQSEVRWSYCLAERLFLQTRTGLLWQEKYHGITPIQSVALLRQLASDRAMKLEIRGKWPNTFKGPEIEYQIETAYRQRLYHWWLYGEVRVGMEYLQREQYEKNPYAVVRVDVVLGNSAPSTDMVGQFSRR